MDFISALLASEFSVTPMLKPRLPALFEPVTPRLDSPFIEEASELEARESLPTRAARVAGLTSNMTSSETVRPIQPYRGIMNVPSNPRTTISTESSSIVAHTSRASDQSVAQTRAEQVELKLPSVQESAGTKNDEAQPATNLTIPSIRPALVIEPQTQRPPAASESHPDTASESAPIVHVNIGRIIVRAISQTPPTPPKRESKTKKLSLDDYLNNRERGGA
jgi:hypothetical protein